MESCFEIISATKKYREISTKMIKSKGISHENIFIRIDNHTLYSVDFELTFKYKNTIFTEQNIKTTYIVRCDNRPLSKNMKQIIAGLVNEFGIPKLVDFYKKKEEKQKEIEEWVLDMKEDEPFSMKIIIKYYNNKKYGVIIDKHYVIDYDKYLNYIEEEGLSFEELSNIILGTWNYEKNIIDYKKIIIKHN